MEEGEGCAPVVGAAAGKVGLAEAGPEFVVEGAAFGWEAEDLPIWMLSEDFADIGGGGGAERLGEDGGVAEESVEFEEDEFGDGDVVAVVQGF